MAAVHTQARGTEPYDKVYCLGYQVHHEDWSPYPRINRLRQTFLDRGYDVDVERLRLVTQSYRQHEHLPEKLKVAYAFENVLLHCGIEIYEDDLIVGEIASPIKSAPIYPEFSVNWILDEVQNHPFEQREHDQFTIRSEEEKQEILELCRWWQGRTLDDYINVRLDDDQLKGSEAGKKIYQTNLYHYAGTGHLAVDYARLMQLGFDGLRQRAQQKLAALDMHDPEFCTKREFYQAVLIMYGAVEKYILRYAALAEEMAAREQEAKRKAELEQIAANCRAVQAAHPRPSGRRCSCSTLPLCSSVWSPTAIPSPMAGWTSGSTPIMRRTRAFPRSLRWSCWRWSMSSSTTPPSSRTPAAWPCATAGASAARA